MAQTEDDQGAGGETKTVYTKRFVTSADADPDRKTEASEDAAQSRPEGLSKPVIIAGVAMVAVALLCFVLAAGFSGGGSSVSDETAQKVYSLNKQIQLVKTKTEAMPNAKDADRGLVGALESATKVAQLQNDYRYLAPAVDKADGRLNSSLTLSTRRNLIPYFAPTVDQSDLGPWYLLDSDKDLPVGVGIPMSFRSGFTWVAQTPYAINEDSTISVSWLAVAEHTPDDAAPQVLAWASADYDITQKTFSNVRTGTTATGDGLRLEVKR